MLRVTRRRYVAAPVEEVWALVSDPHCLPRWWPRTLRVENVEGSGPSGPAEWTKVLQTAEGRGVRADFRRGAYAEGERYGWEQRIAGTPFERHLRAMSVEIELVRRGEVADGATSVEISSRQALRGISRLGSPAMRRAQGSMLEEALDGIERAVAK